MGVPKNKTSKANRRMNRAGRYADFAANAVSLCPQCGALKLPHHACPECGYYKGRPVKQVKAEKVEKAEAGKAE